MKYFELKVYIQKGSLDVWIKKLISDVLVSFNLMFSFAIVKW
jgi:hypothetical protein